LVVAQTFGLLFSELSFYAWQVSTLIDCCCGLWSSRLDLSVGFCISSIGFQLAFSVLSSSFSSFDTFLELLAPRL